MNRALVLLGVVVAGGLAYATKDFASPELGRVRGAFRSGGRGPALEVGAVAEGVGPAAAKVEIPSIPLRTVGDVTLPVAAYGHAPNLIRANEIHLDAQEVMTWYGGTKSVPQESYAKLKAGLYQRYSYPVVIVADAAADWQAVRWIAQTAQDSTITDVWLGVAKSDEPDKLRLLSLRQPRAGTDELPEEETFVVAIDDGEGTIVVSANGEPVATLPADLAMSWGNWRKAHKEADTSKPETTVVVLEAAGTVPVGKVVEVLDVLRGLGIQSERLTGSMAPRPR